MSNNDDIPLLIEPKSVPLCVDLDGTLIHQDTTRTAFFLYCGLNPFRYLQVAGWFLHKRHAYMKQRLSERVDLTNHKWTFSQSVLKMMDQERSAGRKIYMVSATDIAFAISVAKQEPCKSFFTDDNILASHGEVNYRAEAKAELLNNTFGKGKFVYIGNSTDDLKVWKHGKTPIVVSYKESDSLIKSLKNINSQAIILKEFS